MCFGGVVAVARGGSTGTLVLIFTVAVAAVVAVAAAAGFDLLSCSLS